MGTVYNRVPCTYEELQDLLTKPSDFRVVDSRMFEIDKEWVAELQFLGKDGAIYYTCSTPDGPVSMLDLYRLQYFNSRRMNPARWGEFDSETNDG